MQQLSGIKPIPRQEESTPLAKTYSDEQRAAVLASLLAGQSISAVAKEYGIPTGTIRSWKSRIVNENRPNVPAPLFTEEKKATLGELILGLMEAEIIVLQEMVHHFSDADWLRNQSAADVAVLYGVLTDKLFRKIEAIERAERHTED